MKIILDGREIEAEGKQTILEVARENDIYIPSLCDHRQLESFAGCRLCLVEVSGRKGYPPSCSTLIEDGMVIKTDSSNLRKLRRQILELILSEHPNGCLICSEKEQCDEYKSTIRKVGEVTGCVLCSNNGRCELQRVVEAVGVDRIRYPSLYRELDIKRCDPFFDRNYNLCVLCGRCVRICHELRGSSVISFIQRGSNAVVGTVLDLPLHESGCQFCGACVDVCPTGALTERSLKYESLHEETALGICPLCSLGCEMEFMLRNGRILSSRPAETGDVNQGQACVKGRFLLKDVVHHQERIVQPLVRREGKLEAASWEEALDRAASLLKASGGKKTALSVSTQISCESGYLLRKFARDVVGTENIHVGEGPNPVETLREAADERGFTPSFNFNLHDISQADTIMLSGADLPKTHPIIWLEIVKAIRNGARLITVDACETTIFRHAALPLRIRPDTAGALFGLLTKWLVQDGAGSELAEKDKDFLRTRLDKLDEAPAAVLTGIESDSLRKAREMLKKSEKTVFIACSELLFSPRGRDHLSSFWNLAKICGASFMALERTNNGRGINTLFHNEHDRAKILDDAVHERIETFYMAGPAFFPEGSDPKYLIVQNSFMTEVAKRADVVLPAAVSAEMEGVFVNTEGRIQKNSRILDPQGEARPDWWIVCSLAERMGQKGFRYKTAGDVFNSMRENIPAFAGAPPSSPDQGVGDFIKEEPRGQAVFLDVDYDFSPMDNDEMYPYLLLLEEDPDSYRQLELNRDLKSLRFIRNPDKIRMNPDDATKSTLKEGDGIWLESRFGVFEGEIHLSGAVPTGFLMASFRITFKSGNEDSAGRISEDVLRSVPIAVKIKRGN